MILLTLREAQAIVEPIVYGIACSGGEIVYVGMTRKPSARLAQYRNPKYCHNPRLADWLAEEGGGVRVAILHRGVDGLAAAEKREIAKRLPSLFNLAHGGDQAWRNHERKPWMARQGVACPSAIAAKFLAVRRAEGHEAAIEALNAKRAAMSDDERCRYELAVGEQLFEMVGLRPQIDRWLAHCGERVLNRLGHFRSA